MLNTLGGPFATCHTEFVDRFNNGFLPHCTPRIREHTRPGLDAYGQTLVFQITATFEHALAHTPLLRGGFVIVTVS